MKTVNVARLACAALAAAACGAAFAQAGYPSKPVRMIVPSSAGGGTDIVARIIAPELSKRFGQQIVIDNRPGAGTMIGIEVAAKSPADGYTVLMGLSTLAINSALYKKVPYDPRRDFAPITMAVVFANVIVVHPSVPANTLAEFIKLAKEKPGLITYGSSGIGGAGHLAGELLRMMAGIDLVHVPYKGGGPAMQGLLGGQIAAYFATPVAAGPHIKAGKARALATTGATRSPFMPEVPTVAELGYPGYEAINWYAYVAPAKTPKEIVERWNRELVKSLGAPEARELLNKQGLEPRPSTSEELARTIERELAIWGRVVKEAGITAN